MLISCNETKEANTSQANGDRAAMEKEYSEHIHEVYRAIETGDVSNLDSFMAVDFVDHEGNMGKDIVGRDSAKAFLASIHNYFDNLQMEVMAEGTSTDGSYHFVMVHMTGTAKENPWGMPVGHNIDDVSVDVIKLKDGIATDHWSFTSQKDMMEMMNAMQGGNPMPMDRKDTTKQQ